MQIELTHDNHVYVSGPDFVSLATLLVVNRGNVYKIWRRRNSRIKITLWFMDFIRGSNTPECATLQNWYTEETAWLEFLHLKDAVEYIRSNQDERRSNE